MSCNTIRYFSTFDQIAQQIIQNAPKCIDMESKKPLLNIVHFIPCYPCIPKHISCSNAIMTAGGATHRAQVVKVYQCFVSFLVAPVHWACGAVRTTIVPPPAPSWADPTSTPTMTKATPSTENAPMCFQRWATPVSFRVIENTRRSRWLVHVDQGHWVLQIILMKIYCILIMYVAMYIEIFYNVKYNII